MLERTDVRSGQMAQPPPAPHTVHTACRRRQIYRCHDAWWRSVVLIGAESHSSRQLYTRTHSLRFQPFTSSFAPYTRNSCALFVLAKLPSMPRAEGFRKSQVPLSAGDRMRLGGVGQEVLCFLAPPLLPAMITSSLGGHLVALIYETLKDSLFSFGLRP